MRAPSSWPAPNPNRPESGLTAYFLFDRLLVPGALLATIARGAFFWRSHPSDWFGTLGAVLAPGAVLILLLTSRPPKRAELTGRAAAGILISFAAPWLLELPRGVAHPAAAILILSTSLFYFIFMVWSYAALGRSLGVTPSIKELRANGPYAILRHPIYASHLLLTGVLLLARPSPPNLLAFALLAIGIILRIGAEESILETQPAYRDYRRNVPNGLLTPALAAPLAILAATKLILWAVAPAAPRILRIQTSFPILSLNPLIYDDWASVFVGNHIYPRLLPEPGREWIPAAAQEARYECVEHGASPLSPCRRERLLLKLREFVSCQGGSIRPSTLKGEIENVLSSKNWILPGHTYCRRDGYDLCLEYAGIPDAARRLQNVYFRFGWSAQDFSRDIVGVAPYCFKIETRSGGEIRAGTLVPRADASLPRVELFTSNDPNDVFDVSLFGAPGLLRGERRNIDLITPVAYYAVSNPALPAAGRPWNSRAVRAILREHLEKFDLIYRTDTLLSAWMPEGAPVTAANTASGRVEFVIPDYLPECAALTARLNAAEPHMSAVCANTTVYIEDRIRLGRKPWFGFLTPLSPGAPGRTSVIDQYFSSASRESWLRGAKEPMRHFYRVGLGKALITIDGRHVCDITGNPMGQSDLVISDFVYCP